MDKAKSYITVLIGNDNWALLTSLVEEIVPIYNFYEPAKGLNESIIGVINYRGKLINLIDTKKFLIGEKKELKISDKILILKNNTVHTALLVDDVNDIVSIDKVNTESHFIYMKNTYRIIDTERLAL